MDINNGIKDKYNVLKEKERREAHVMENQTKITKNNWLNITHPEDHH